jgi:very-short-patch-repair endonuclease
LIAITNESISRQVSFDWCRSNETNNHLPFDFVIKHLKLIIELDGRQHFEQVMNWKSPNENQKNDIYKMKCAINNEYSVIRLLQEDVHYDRNYWFEKLKPLIKKYTNATIVYIGSENQYIQYKEKMTKYEIKMFD